MEPREVLADPHVSPSAAWDAVCRCLGAGALAYEPETLHLELERKGVSWNDVGAKVLAAQTCLVTRDWLWNFDVLFAYAVVAGGGTAAADAIHHPTVIDLAWAVDDLEVLTNKTLDHDAGFDPDRVDPAVAVLLHDEGWVLTPRSLSFAQESLDQLTHVEPSFRQELLRRWTLLELAPEDKARALYAAAAESPLRTQLGHLLDCALEIRARTTLRARHVLRAG